MSFVLGRNTGPEDGPVGPLGTYRALDGSSGAPIYVDLDRPHSVMIVGKRGYGKSYTLGVMAESLSKPTSIAPVIIDPMGVFTTLAGGDDSADIDAKVIDEPEIVASSLEPRSWCELLDLSPESAAGALVWQAATHTDSLSEMHEHIDAADAPQVDKRSGQPSPVGRNVVGVFARRTRCGRSVWSRNNRYRYFRTR